MGPNGSFKSSFDEAFNNFRLKYPSNVMNQAFINQVLKDAWISFIAKTNYTSTVITAFKKSNIRPLILYWIDGQLNPVGIYSLSISNYYLRLLLI